MTCDHALELLLETDLAELDGVGGSPLAAHVRECAKCRVVAARIAMDTRALARADFVGGLAARPSGVRRSYRLRPVAAAGALAAVLALAVFGVRRAAEGPRTTAAVPAPAARSTVVTKPSPVGVPVPAAVAVKTPVAHVARNAPTPAQVTGRRFAEPVAATPVRLVASQPVAVRATGDADGVTVRAPAGTRSAVLRTGNAAITVVWLY